MKSGIIISAAAAAMVFLSMSLAVFAVPPPTATLIPAPREMCVTGGEYWAKKPPKMEKVDGIPPEGYELSIRPDGMTICYSLVVMCRCHTNDVDGCVYYNYVGIVNVKFAVDHQGRLVVRMPYYFNPTPNDTNLEPKR